MESEFEPNHDLPESEPILEVVEGDAQETVPEKSIVPNAFERVLEKVDEPTKYVDVEAPPYKNRAFIGAVCLIGGIFAGRMTMQPKVETKFVDRQVPAVTSPAPTDKVSETPKVANAFRELTNLGEFDPWQPLNGGFPLPPKSTPANIVARSGGITPTFSGPPPSGLSGRITPMDPSDFAGTLPTIGGPAGSATNLPTEPVPGGKQSGNATIVDNGSAKPGGEHYVAISMDGPDPEKGQSSITGIAAALGGSARTFTHMAEDGTVEARGVLVIVSAAKYEEAKSKIEALGGASIDSSYDGLATDKQSQIQSKFVTRLAKLRDRQKDLLVDFLDDAQPVRQINEAIDHESRAVNATRLAGSFVGKVVFVVTLK